MKCTLHERKPNRWFGFDYSDNACYFITICTQNRIKYFGGVYNQIMCIDRLGAIVWRQWEWMQTQYPYIQSHGFIVMPNHVHGIIEINSEFINKNRDCDHVGTGLDLSLPDKPITNKPKILSLSNIISAFKTTTSKLIHNCGFPQFQWQRSFYDHVIRDEKSFQKICWYVIYNPAIWERDRNNI